jgi:hypothetical protein
MYRVSRDIQDRGRFYQPVVSIVLLKGTFPHDIDNILIVSHCRKPVRKTGNANSGAEAGTYQLNEPLDNFQEDEKNSELLILVSACPLRTSARFLHGVTFLT